MQASTFGSMEPGANWPWAMYSRAWDTVISEICSCSGVLKFMHTFSTAVRMISMLSLIHICHF